MGGNLREIPLSHSSSMEIGVRFSWRYLKAALLDDFAAISEKPETSTSERY